MISKRLKVFSIAYLDSFPRTQLDVSRTFTLFLHYIVLISIIALLVSGHARRKHDFLWEPRSFVHSWKSWWAYILRSNSPRPPDAISSRPSGIPTMQPWLYSGGKTEGFTGVDGGLAVWGCTTSGNSRKTDPVCTQLVQNVRVVPRVYIAS